MNAEICVSYSDMTSMDSYYSPSAVQSRDHQTDLFRTFPAPDTKYSPTAFLPNKGHAYGEKSRSPFQQECPSLDAAAAGQGTFSKYHLFMQRSSCKTPPEEGKLQPDGGHSGALVSCYGECYETERKLKKFRDSVWKSEKSEGKGGLFSSSVSVVSSAGENAELRRCLRSHFGVRRFCFVFSPLLRSLARKGSVLNSRTVKLSHLVVKIKLRRI